MNETIETKVYRGSRKHRPIVGSVNGHWTTDLTMAMCEGQSMQLAAEAANV